MTLQSLASRTKKLEARLDHLEQLDQSRRRIYTWVDLMRYIQDPTWRRRQFGNSTAILSEPLQELMRRAKERNLDAHP